MLLKNFSCSLFPPFLFLNVSSPPPSFLPSWHPGENWTGVLWTHGRLSLCNIYICTPPFSPFGFKNKSHRSSLNIKRRYSAVSFLHSWIRKRSGRKQPLNVTPLINLYSVYVCVHVDVCVCVGGEGGLDGWMDLMTIYCTNSKYKVRMPGVLRGEKSLPCDDCETGGLKFWTGDVEVYLCVRLNEGLWM